MMPVYTVHAPWNGGADQLPVERVVFVRDGFHVWAAFGGVLWFVVHRLWLALLGYVVLMFAVVGMLRLIHASSGVSMIVLFLLVMLTGFEAASLRRWTLSRGRWRQLGVVAANDRDAAERRFFDRWLEGRLASGDMTPTDRGSSSAQPSPRTSGSAAESHDGIVGLFPNSEANP